MNPRALSPRDHDLTFVTVKVSVDMVKMQSFWPLTPVNVDTVARRRGNPSGH